MQNKLVFLCTGNTCRSPMAMALYAARMPQADVSSAGVEVDEGDPAAQNARLAVAQRGLSLEGHRARRLSSDDGESLILTMTQAHAEAARRLLPQARIRRLACHDISDPYGGDLERYIACRDELETAVDGFIASQMEQLCFTDPWSQAAVESFLQNGGEAVVKQYGYVLLRTVAGETELMRIAVLPEMRRRGLGAGLLEAALRPNMYLEVRASNLAARALYERAGFSQNGLRRGYYRDGEDAVLYKR